MHTQGAQVSKSVHPAAKMCTQGAGCTLRPPLNKKLFSVQRPSGLKRAEWSFFFHLLNFFDFFFTFPHVHSSLSKNEIRKKKIPTSQLSVFLPIQLTGNNFLLKDGLNFEHWLSSQGMFHFISYNLI